jgi:outer membrane protein OmpA-like peptidoglycan-associated protein
MNEPKPREKSDQHRIAGEDMPRWLTTAFAVVGTFVAAGAAWLWMSRESRPPETPIRSEAPAVQGAPVAPSPIAAAPAPPAPPGAEPPKAQGAEQAQAAGALPSPPASPAEAPAGAPPAPVAAPPAPATAEPPAPAAAPVMPKECPPLIAVPFKFDSAIVSAADVTAHAEDIAGWLKDEPGAKLAVQGYADSVGWDQYNLLLSYRRAKAVVALLTKSGIPAQRITIRAAGSHEPIEGIPADAPENRRATIQVVGVKDCPSTDR